MALHGEANGRDHLAARPPKHLRTDSLVRQWG